MKTNNDQLDPNLTPEEESAIIIASGCFVMFLLIAILIVVSAIAFANKGIIGDKEDFCIKTTSEEKK